MAMSAPLSRHKCPRWLVARLARRLVRGLSLQDRHSGDVLKLMCKLHTYTKDNFDTNQPFAHLAKVKLLN